VRLNRLTLKRNEIPRSGGGARALARLNVRILQPLRVLNLSPARRVQKQAGIEQFIALI
jgi:hypothetical protein